MGGSAPAPKKESRRENWETFWKDKEILDNVYSNEDRILRHLTSVSDVSGKKILEIGAGTGRDSFPLIRLGAAVVQLDYAENSLRILKRLAEEIKLPVTIVGGDAFRMPFPDETFDVVFHQGLLEHFHAPQAEALLRENIRVLKTGGLLLVDVPQRYHIYTLAKHMLMALGKWFAGWERSFSTRELRTRMQSLGLTPVHVYGEYMVPSFFYRSFREAVKSVGVTLPRHPQPSEGLSRLRKSVRSAILTTPLPLYTGFNIGVVGKK